MADYMRMPKMIKENSITRTRCNNIDILCDELLREILLRLPNCKSVIQTKFVCKRWNALASHSRFFVDFLHLKLENDNQNETFAFVLRYEPDVFQRLWEQKKYRKFLKPSIFHIEDSSFSPFHRLEDENASVPPVLVASCRDLLLYSRHEKEKYQFYISNVQTGESVMLPSPPSYCGNQAHFVALYCSPFYSSGTEISYDYSVVAVCCATFHSTSFHAHIFSSHCDSQWCDKVLSLPQQCEFRRPTSLSAFSFYFVGKLHFSCRQGLLGFDLNDIRSEDEIQCHLVKWPAGMLQGGHQVCLSKGRLHIAAISFETSTLRVWVLEDYEESNWMLIHSVEMSDWVPRRRLITKKLQKFAIHHSELRVQKPMRVLGFHPSRSDIIYLLVPGYIFLFDLSTKVVKLACRIPVAVAKKYKHYLCCFYSFPVIFQTWPTPLPPLAQGLNIGVNTTHA